MAVAIFWILCPLLLFPLFLRCFALTVGSSRTINPVTNKALPASGGEVSIVTHLIAGAVARGVSILVMYPLDTLKTRFQVPPSAAANLPPLSLSVLFRGVVGSLVGQIPYGMLTFGLYEVYKSFFLSVLFPK
eukprot:gene42187-57122_t